MQRLANFEVGHGIRQRPLRCLARVAFGVATAGSLIVVRGFIDLWAPSIGPFALLYPTVLLAVLYGRWEAGLAAWGVAFFWIWLMVLLPVGTFEFADPGDQQRVALNMVASLLVLFFAESFRQSSHRAMHVRNLEIERREMLMQELEHRTRNNFALVASLLSLQRRTATSPETRAIIDEAIGRIESFAGAYADLSMQDGDPTVAVAPYLQTLLGKVSAGALHDGIRLETRIEECDLPREIAVAIGLFANEAVTNAAKHAFAGRDEGSITVTFRANGEGWRLTVSDSGNGNDGTAQGGGGERLGTRLFAAFAAQARADYRIEVSSTGRTLTLWSIDGAPDEAASVQPPSASRANSV